MSMRGSEWLTQAVASLQSFETPAVDAEILLAYVADLPRQSLRTLELTAEQEHHANLLLARREAGEPVQYITGEAPFRHLVLHIGPGALIPRPETELLVDHALVEVAKGARLIADLGAGAGPMAIAIATEASAPVHVVAVEREEDALVWLRRNVGEFAPAIEVVAADVRDLRLDGFDLVLANPPYLPDGAQLPAEVAEHEPAAALWGGGVGTDVPALFADCAFRMLRPGGLLLMEHSDQHQDAIVELLEEWDEVQRHCDLAGRPRFISARRP